ncbi:MAG TPA: hypothetical protein VJ552_05410 [Sediminibacterium sp.]|nr:hypothetical protein [Sediminibacterium sp.]
MKRNEKIAFMNEVAANIITYLEGQKDIVDNALKAYDPNPLIDGDRDVRQMRETEAIKLRDRSNELSRHIAVIKAMYPTIIKPATRGSRSKE